MCYGKWGRGVGRRGDAEMAAVRECAAAAHPCFSMCVKGRRGPTNTEGGVMAEVDILRNYLRQICL